MVRYTNMVSSISVCDSPLFISSLLSPRRSTLKSVELLAVILPPVFHHTTSADSHRPVCASCLYFFPPHLLRPVACSCPCSCPPPCNGIPPLDSCLCLYLRQILVCVRLFSRSGCCFSFHRSFPCVSPLQSDACPLLPRPERAAPAPPLPCPRPQRLASDRTLEALLAPCQLG